jgi:beta-lactam-binding protein with PASTA domain
VALKVLFPELSIDQTFVERFRREAQAAANLAHPNIVQVFDWGEDQGTYFIVMEYVEGRSLSTMLSQSTRIHPNDAATIAAKVAGGLAYAHRRGVVHRDVKPGNILLTSEGDVKVTDFGIALAINTSDNLTQVGSVMGTAAYFSPEQAEGLTVDVRSDLYSLGVVLFEMVTGRPPFVGDSPIVVASKHVNEVAPLARAINPSVPAALEAIICMAMAKSPSDRYQSAEDFRADLLRFTEGQPVIAEARLQTMAATGEISAATAVVGAVGLSAQQTSAIPLDGRPYAAPPAKKQRLKWTVPIVLVALLIAGLIVGLVARGNQPAKNVAIPNVAGMSVASAESALVQAGFSVRPEHSKVPSALTPEGSVAGTDPTIATLQPVGTVVTLQISIGDLAKGTIPDVSGYAQDAATAQLQALGLTVVVAYVPSPLPQGSVVSTVPAAGRSVWSKTSITINLPVIQTPTVPNLIGLSPVNAGASLASAGFTVGSTTQVCSNTVTTGLVSASNPKAGSMSANGSSVDLTISSGVCQVTIPSTIYGQNTGTAITALTDLGLVVGSNVGIFAGDCTDIAPSTVAGVSTTDGGTALAADVQVPYGSTVYLQTC